MSRKLMLIDFFTGVQQADVPNNESCWLSSIKVCNTRGVNPIRYAAVINKKRERRKIIEGRNRTKVDREDAYTRRK